MDLSWFVLLNIAWIIFSTVLLLALCSMAAGAKVPNIFRKLILLLAPELIQE